MPGEIYSGDIAGNNYVYVGGEGYWRDKDLGLQYVRNRWLENTLGNLLLESGALPKCSVARLKARPTVRNLKHMKLG